MKIIQNYSGKLLISFRGEKAKKEQYLLQKYMSVSSEISHALNVHVANDFNDFRAGIGRNLANAIDSTGDPIVNGFDLL